MPAEGVASAPDPLLPLLNTELSRESCCCCCCGGGGGGGGGCHDIDVVLALFDGVYIPGAGSGESGCRLGPLTDALRIGIGRSTGSISLVLETAEGVPVIGRSAME